MRLLMVVGLALTCVAQASSSVIPTQVKLDQGRLDVADQAFKERAKPEKAHYALSEYRRMARAAESLGRPDPGVLWRLSMACYFVGMRLTDSSEEKAKIHLEGKKAGLAAVSLAPKCAPCHFWAAINMVLHGQEVGVFKMYFGLSEVESLLKKSIELDPKYAFSGAYRLLGLIQQKLPSVLGGDNDRAKEYFEKAIQSSPDEPLNYLFLAELLRDKFDEPEEALRVARKGALVQKIDAERLEALEAREKLQKWVDGADRNSVKTAHSVEEAKAG